MQDMEVAASYNERYGLYRGHTKLSMDEAAQRFPEAMVLFDLQCSHLVERRDIIVCVNKYGRLSVETANRPRSEMRTIWHSKACVWVRYSGSVSRIDHKLRLAKQIAAKRQEWG